METNPIRAFAEMWARAFQISGRTRRATYWWAFFVNLAVSFVIGLLSGPLVVYDLLTIIPGITMSVRRLHDSNKRGWWLLLGLIPYGGIVVLILLLLDSDGANRFGSSPKYGDVPL